MTTGDGGRRPGRGPEVLATIEAIEAGPWTPDDGFNMALGTTTGTKIGTTVSQKLAFHAATPHRL